MKNQLHKMGPPSALLGLKKHVRRNLEFWYSLINLTFPFEDIAKKKKKKKKKIKKKKKKKKKKKRKKWMHVLFYISREDFYGILIIIKTN